MSTQIATSHKASAVAEGLKTLLADTYALLAQTHLAHWNVEGSDFFQLHEAFENQYKELFKATDEIAEQLRALGVLAPAGLKTLAKLSRIEEMAVESAPAKDYVAHLIECHELLVSNAMNLQKVSGDSEDLETQDLVIERLRAHQKTLWMLRSFLKNR